MMNDKDIIEVLQEDIVIPDVVLDKANEAFKKIKNSESLNDKVIELDTKVNRKKHKKIGVAVLIAVCALGTITVGAKTYQIWSNSIEKEMHVTNIQKQEAEKSELADFPGMSVTDEGITITAQQSIVDNYYAYISFKVEGYDLKKGKEPGFGDMRVMVDGKDVSYGGSFYDGLSENYVMNDGSLEYRINLSGSEINGSLLNKDIYVEFNNIGTYVEKAGDIETDTDRNWKFDWTLKGNSDIYTAKCNEKLGNTGAVVTGAEISPISIKAIYDFPRQEIEEKGIDETGAEVSHKTYSEPPALVGVKLKDGTLLPYLYMGPGSQGYLDKQSNEYETRSCVDRILDVNDVESLLFVKSYPDGEESLQEDNLYIVNIR